DNLFGIDILAVLLVDWDIQLNNCNLGFVKNGNRFYTVAIDKSIRILVVKAMNCYVEMVSLLVFCKMIYSKPEKKIKCLRSSMRWNEPYLKIRMENVISIKYLPTLESKPQKF